MRTISYIILALLIGFSSKTFAATGVSGDGQINQCDQKRYSITLTNNTGNDVTDIEVTNDLSLLTGFSYVAGSSAITATTCSVSNVDPTSGTTYDLNTLCGSAFTLADGEAVTIEYDLETDCTATSGSNQAAVTYTMLGVTQSESAQLSIEVLPGAITIKKEPAVQSAAVGDPVSWNLIVENSGLGTIENVVVTDALGAGLTYVSSSPAGTNTDQTTTWNATQIPALASMDPGETVTITINAIVSGCDDLDNTADVSFGCGLGSSCFDTATDGGTATASIQRLVKTPLLEFSSPDITFDYCGAATPDPVTIVISNTGDGTATNIQTFVDLTPLTVSNVSTGATYDSNQHAFVLDAETTIPPNESYTLTFSLEQPDWCGSTLPPSPLLWQKKYGDECKNDFFPPVEVSNITGSADTPTLSITKTGPEVIQIGETITYAIAASYSGLTSCNGSSSTDVTVTDTIPDGFTVDSASSNSNYNGGQGTWTPGANGTGGTYSWLFDPATVTNFEATLTLQSPATSECAAFCNTVFDNTVTATVTDCCGCDLSSSASQTTAIECDGSGISSNKTVVPAVSQRCDELTYTNNYTFDSTVTGIALNELELTEQAGNNQTYKSGTLVIELDGTPQSCGTATQGAAGDPVVISLAGCPATSVAGTSLDIIYTLVLEEDTTGGRCADLSFYSWSDLNLGTNHPSGDCFGDRTIHETVPINVEAPAMSLSIDGLNQITSICDKETVTITLEQTSTTAAPRDVHLVLSGLNYYVTDPTVTTCTGVAPDQCAPTVDNGDYHWDFADGFTGNGQQAVITLEVQKRCTGGPELAATLFFDDKCNDDDTSDENCSISASDTPALLTSGDLLVTKTPDVYQATENQVTWTIYVTNRGDGTAHNVWIDDILGSGLKLPDPPPNPYTTVTVSPDTGVTITENQDHGGGGINGVTIAINEMAPGEKREITVVADIVDCDNLTNAVSASWGCPEDCQIMVTDNSTVEIPTPNLVYTGAVGTGSLAPCETFPGRIFARNSGQTTVYNVSFSQNLPAGMNYVPDSTRWRLNGGSWNGPNVATFNPTITATNTLVWTATQIAALTSCAVSDEIEIEYQVTTDCIWTGGNATLSSNYENPCGASFTGGDRTFTLSPNEVDLRVVKRRTSPAGDVPLGCDQAVTWEIDVTNNSGFAVGVVRVTDTVGDGFNTISSSDPGATVSGSQIDWEIGPLAAGVTTTLHVSATSDSVPCGTDLDNTVSIQWGCASSGIDNNPATDDYDCLNTDQTTATHSSTRAPAAALANLTFAPASIDACNHSTTMTLSFENSGPTDASNLDLVLNLPAGISYLPGTAQFGIGTDAASAALSSIADPASSGSTLTFTNTGDITDNLTDVLEAAGGNDTAVLQFDVASSCYTGGNVSGNLFFYDCCGSSQHSSGFNQALPSNEPVLTVTKTPTAGQIDCNATKAWTITVTNTGSGNAEVVRIEDSPGAWLTVIPGPASDDVTDMGGGRYGWEFNNLAAGSSVTRTLTTQLSPQAPQNNCAAARRRNTAEVFWGCGTTGDATDGDPTTTNYACEDSTPVSVTTSPLPMPDLQVTDIIPNITCDADGSFTDSIEVIVRNHGDGDTLSDFTVTVSDGTHTYTGTYSGTLASGASTTITVDTTSWNPNCNDCNPYTLTATVDAGDTVCECNETNNTRTENYTAPIPKLAVTAITPDLSCNGESFVDITIANQGCTAVTSGIDIAISGDLSGTGSTSSSIAAGASETVRISLGTPACDTTYDITATVDPADNICECNADNHSLTDSFTLPCCSIDLEKATNTEDADSPPGPYIPDGETVTWTYVVTNTGNTAINGITLSDDQLGTISCPSNSLAIGASLICEATATVSATMGNQYANNATVTGTPVDSSGNPIGDDLTASDPSHFHRYAPAITIEKTTNGEDADTPTGPFIPVGSPVQWTYTVTNTGNLPLTGITVEDSIEGVISCPATTLDVGGTMTCTANGTATAGQYSNDATVTGTSPTGDTVSATDPSHYFGETGGIDIEKSTNGVDADDFPGPYIPSGDPVTWLYRVTNTGNVVLTNIAVVDDQGVTVTCPGDTLDPGASMDCDGSGIANIPQYSNTATVTGVTPSGADVTASDPSHYYSVLPSIALEKATNGVDADTPTGPFVPVGSSVQWTYTVTNTGIFPLTNVIVTDSVEGVISCPATTLDVGGTMTCTASGTATAGQYSNNATVTGTSSTGDTVSATDPSHYFGETGGIDIEKSTNGVDADDSPGPYIPSGDPVTWLYRVTNTGNVVLSNIAVVDDQGVTVTCPGDTLDPGASMDCTGSGIANIPQYSNNATVTGVTPSGVDVTASDPSHYYSVLPSIALEKATNGEDADFPEGPRLNVGDSVTWSYVVTNDGEILINNIVITDDQGVSVTCPRTSLDVGESMTCTGTGTAIAGQYRNAATVTGDPIAGPQVTATDPSHYFAEVPEPPPGKPKRPRPPQDTPKRVSRTSQLPPARTTDNEDCCLTAQKELVAHRKGAEAITVRRDLYYYTHMAMYLAYELADLQRITDQLPRFPHYRLSSQRERVVELARRASISNVATVSTRSGLGVTMDFADGRENETGLRQQLEALAEKAGWQGNISEIEPLLFEYFGAIPVKEERNGSHWDPAGMDTELSPLAWGMTILAQSVELERLATQKTADDRFIRELLGWQLQRKISMLASFLRQRSDTERYVPHRFAQPENKIFTLKAMDNDYYLVDQAALLLGISRLGITARTHELPFGKDIDFIREVLWQAMDSRINEESGTWQPYIDSDGSDAAPEAAEYLVSDLLFAVLAADMANKAEDSWFASFAYEGRIDDTVDFLRKASKSNGTIGERVGLDSSAGDSSFFATTALARMELLAGETTAGWERFLAAERICNDKRLHLYRPDGLQSSQISYTPLELGIFAGFLNEAARQQVERATTVSDRGLAFIERVLFQGGLQIEPGRDGSHRNQPIIADGNRNVVPLLVGSGANLRNAKLPPVAVSRIMLNLPLFGRTDRDYRNEPDRFEHAPIVSDNTEPFFHHYKKRTITLEEAALALLYLDDASKTLNRLSSWKKNPYLRDNTGLETLSRELTRIWKTNLFAISFHYSRGIPLTFSPSLEKRFNLSRDELEERYRQELQSDSGTLDKDEFIPLFLEYNKGEPFATEKAATGWAGTLPDDTISTRALTQFERAQIRFLENPGDQDMNGTNGEPQADDVRFIRDIITMQLGSKMDFVQQLVSKSARFLPKTFTVIRDSRKEIIDIEPGAEKGAQLDLLSFALLLADMEQWSAENDQNQATDAQQRQVLLDKSVSRLLTMLTEGKRQGVKNRLLDTAMTLDLLAQLANHRQLKEAQRNAVTELVKAEAERIAGVLKDGDPIKRLAIIGTVESGRNQLAAYSAVITALVRVQTTIDGMDLDETIRSLAVHFDSYFWNDQLGGYHGQVASYASNAFTTKTYSYSELDLSLTINSLAATLEFLSEEERPQLIGHLVSFARRLLVSQESSTSVLNGLPQSSKEFDFEIIQDMDLVATSHKNIYPGDVLRYEIEVYNRCKQGQPTAPLEQISIRDILPKGVSSLPGTTKIDGKNAEDPELRGGSLYWQLARLDDHASISFAVYVPPAYRFSELENRFEVRADMGGDRRNRFCDYTSKIIDPVSRPTSSVDVVYYYDTNLNQRFDRDETSAKGISTIIDGKPVSVRTDNANRFEKLSPGWYLLTPDRESMDSFIVPTQKTPVQTKLSANEHKTVYIGLVQYTDVEGLIYDDRNHNGQKEENEPALSRARVTLKNRPGYYGYSGRDGYFRIKNIPTDDRSRVPAVIFSDIQPYIENNPDNMTSIGINIVTP